MENLVKNEDTQKNVKMNFVDTMKLKGLKFGDRSKTPKKTLDFMMQSQYI